MHQVIGVCGNCGGAVMVPMIWHGIYPPVPTCASCGSTAAPPKGPVIPMNPQKTKTTSETHLSASEVKLLMEQRERWDE